MDFKVFTWLGLSLAFALTLVTTDLPVAQAQRRITPCRPRPCHINRGGKVIGAGNLPSPEERAEIENLVESGRATIDQLLLLGNTYQVLENYDLAQESYSIGLDQAKKAGDLEGQAIALNRLGEVLAATGRTQEAGSRLTEAGNLYRQLGDRQRVTEVNQQLIRLSNPQILNNPSQQLPGL